MDWLEANWRDHAEVTECDDEWDLTDGGDPQIVVN
jgi:hypothetical protein